jgi:hypothetical protein
MLVYHKVGFQLQILLRSTGKHRLSLAPIPGESFLLQLLVPFNALIGSDEPYALLRVTEGGERIAEFPMLGSGRDEGKEGWYSLYDLSNWNQDLELEVQWPGTQTRTFIRLLNGELRVNGQDTFVLQLEQPQPG